jgi:hypothetical protein
MEFTQIHLTIFMQIMGIQAILNVKAGLIPKQLPTSNR